MAGMSRITRALVSGGVAAGLGLALVGIAFAHGPEPAKPTPGRVLSIQGSTGAKLWIVHVQRGCHSWTDGKRMGETVRLTLERGGRLRVFNNDLDAHRLVQLAGPRLALGPAMMPSHATTVVFRKPGLYRLRAVVSEMPGMPKVKTVGPDHVLFLVVRVR